MNKFNSKILVSYFYFLIIITFFIEVIYYLPSPTGDGSTFLKVALNICRYDTFTLHGSELGSKYTAHGWVQYYLKSKLSYECNFRFFFLFNFLVKIITLYFSYLFLKKKINKIFIFIILFFIFIIQLKLQFRPETFALMLSSIIIFLHDKKYFKSMSIFFGILFYTHIIYFCFLGLFFLIFFYKIYFNLKILTQCTFVFISTLFVLDLIYPYNIIDYLQGTLIENSGTWSSGEMFNFHFFKEYYLITKVHGGGFLPLWGVSFFLIIFILLQKNKLFYLSLPFLYYFSLRNLPGNYYMVGFTPILIFFNIFFRNNNYFDKSRLNKIFLYLILIISLIGSAQYIGRNLLTIKSFKNDLENTSSFIDKNLEEINEFPSFGFHLNEKIFLEEYGIKNCQNCNSSRVKKKKYNLNDVNGKPNPCPNSNINPKNYSLKLFGLKIFSSNSGYGVYICKIN